MNFALAKRQVIVIMRFKLLMVAACLSATAWAQTEGEKKENYPVEVHGTVRSKYEYQTEEGEGRFEVRNARINVEGKLSDVISYKAEIDLCDEGTIKMLDAYTRLKPVDDFAFTIGQFRVPFTIDAHRSPHKQYFANRSFIAKQVGNVRDVGAAVAYTLDAGFPIILEAGIFNGSGLTNQKNYWTKEVNYSAKAQFLFPKDFNLTLSAQKIKPSVSIMMYDAGAYWDNGNWHVEAEYLYKRYANHAFKDVHAFDSFISYGIKTRKGLIQRITPLVRYDFMTDHSNGTMDDDGNLTINDYKRQRITGGVTLSLKKPFISDIRLNYEKYIYRDGAVALPSEKDKIVVEFMTRF